MFDQEKVFYLVLIVLAWALTAFSIFSRIFKNRFPKLYKFCQSKIFAGIFFFIFALIIACHSYFDPNFLTSLPKVLLIVTGGLILIFLIMFLVLRHLGKKFRKEELKELKRKITETCPSIHLLSIHFGVEAEEYADKDKKWFKEEGNMLAEHANNCENCKAIMKQLAYGATSVTK